MTKARKGRRRQGRPVAAESGDGKEAVLNAALQLLHELPPSMVTIASIARAAMVDPALVRYYYRDRETLLLSVVDHLLDTVPKAPRADVDASTAIRERIRGAFRFTRSAKHMQRLMLDELARSDSQAMREKAVEANVMAKQAYAEIQKRDKGEELVSFDPLLLHIAVIGLCDFFATAGPIIEALEPNADYEKLAKKYEAFVTSLVLDGLRQR